MRNRRTTAVFALPLALAMCTVCGKEKQVIIGLAESSSVMELHSGNGSTDDTGTVEARSEDIVNGHRFSDNNQVVYYKTEENELRDHPSTDGIVMGKVKWGDVLRCTAVDVRWFRFNRNGKIVYSTAEGLKAADHSVPDTKVQTEYEGTGVGIAPHWGSQSFA